MGLEFDNVSVKVDITTSFSIFYKNRISRNNWYEGCMSKVDDKNQSLRLLILVFKKTKILFIFSCNQTNIDFLRLGMDEPSF